MVNSCVLLSDNDPLLRIGQVQTLLYIKALSDGIVIDFLMFTSRPSPMEWSLIFLCLHQGPPRWNGHWFFYFTSRPSPMEWSLIFVTSRPSPMEWSLIFLCLHQGPLRWNGHWFSYVYSKTLSDGMIIVFFLYIKTLSNGMVIDILMFTSRPSPMEWSLIFLCLHQGPLRWNGHWFSYVYSKTLSDGMIIVFFLYIKALSNGMVIDILMFTSRPSPMEWSLIFLCLHQGPLQWNGHWFLCYSKTLSNGMVIYQGPLQWNGHWFVTSRPSPMEWSLIFLCLHQSPLQWNGHWFLCHIKTLSNGMVINFLVTSRPSPMEWLLIFVTLRPSPVEWLSLVFTFHITSLFTELIVRFVWIDFYSSFSSCKSGQN